MKMSDDDYHWMGGKKRVIEMDAIWLVTALVLLLVFVAHCNGTPTPTAVPTPSPTPTMTPTMTPWPVPTNTPTPWPTATRWPTPVVWPTEVPCELCVTEGNCPGWWQYIRWASVDDGWISLCAVPEEGWEQWHMMSRCFYGCLAHLPTPALWAAADGTPTPLPCNQCQVCESPATCPQGWPCQFWTSLADGTRLCIFAPEEETIERWQAMSDCFYRCRAHMGVW